MKRLRSDRGGEYDTNSLTIFCEKNGIIHETGLSNNMLGEPVLTACFLLNKVLHKKLDPTPYELWKGYAPNLNYLKVWGCLAKVALSSHKHSNICPKTFDVVVTGYAQNDDAYRFISLSYFCISEYKDAESFEHVFPL